MFLHLKKSQNNAFIVLHGTPVTLHCHFYRKFSYQGDSSRFESLVGWGVYTSVSALVCEKEKMKARDTGKETFDSNLN